MIHLTSMNFSPKEIIQNVFSPLVSCISSPVAEDICQKNNLSFVEMVQPFSRLSSDAHFRDVSGTSVSVKGLRLNICDVSWRPPQTILARKMLNEAVSSAQCDKTKFLKIDENILIETPTSELWFEQWRETFLTVQFPSDHEFTRHFLCCLIVVSSSDPNPLEAASQLTKKVQLMQNVTPPKLPKWFTTDTLNCYVLLHDARTGEVTKAQQGFESLKLTYGEHRCFLIQINSCQEQSTDNTDLWVRYIKRHQRTEQTTDQDSAPKTPQDMSGVTSMPTAVQMSTLETPPPEVVTGEVMIHPLSPVQEIATDTLNSAMSTSTDSLITTPMNPNVWINEADIDAPHGMWLSSNDIETLKHFVQDFTVRALIPYVEKLVGLLNDSIANKKGVSRSLLSATKRWFVTNKPGVTGTQNAVVYTTESTELQTRKLGDLYFMFGNYGLAFQSYHQAKRDFNADSAWQYYAGALEMAALSAFMQGTCNKKTYDYMEEAIVTYLNICKLPQFATRATMLSIECLKVAKLYGDAAKQLIRMTSEDSDLRSALLLEQASYCFLLSQPPLFRKYSFHSVLAGFRYSKCGQRKHAFRCYKQAYNVFENRGWSLAEDHIQYTIGKQAVTLKKLDEASAALAHLLRPSSLQSASQQAAFLREYIATQKAFLQQNDISDILHIALPSIVQNMTRVLVTSLPPVTIPHLTPATNININSNLDEEWKWNKLEEMVVQLALKKPLMIFKPTRALFTCEVPSIENPLCIHGEPIEINLTLENTIKPSIAFDDINLLWIFTNENDETISNKILFKTDVGQDEMDVIENVIASTSIKSVQLNEHEKKSLSIRLTPRLTGKLQIFGVVGKISAVNDSSNLLGQITFDRIPIKSMKSKETTLLSADKLIDYDKKLEILILPPAPALHVNFSLTPYDVLAGEIIPININLTNAGADSLNEIYVGTENPRWVLINPEESELPLSVLKDFRDLTNEAFSKDKEARKQHVFKLFPGDCTINPKETKTTQIWLQAPYKKGTCEIKILIYYSMPSGYPKLKYRLVRHVWNFNVLESISIEGNCNIGNTTTNELGIDLNIKNLNQVHHPLATEIMLHDVTLYSPDYKIDSNKKVIYMNSPGYNRIFIEKSGLKSTECLNLRFALTETSSVYDGLNALDFNKKRFTNFNIQKQINDAKKCIPSFTKLGSFLMKTETKFVKIFGQIGNSEEFNNIISIPDRHLTVCVTWKAILNDNSSVQRIAYGQHFVQLRNLYESIYCPTIDRTHQTSFVNHENLFSIFDFKTTINNDNIEDEESGGWAIHNVSISRRTFLEDESQMDIQDYGQTMGKVY